MTQTLIPEWSLGERLAKARHAAGITTQVEMAALLSEKLGRRISDSTVASWEKDRGQPRRVFDVLRAWSEITGVPVTWLVVGTQLVPYLSSTLADETLRGVDQWTHREAS